MASSSFEYRSKCARHRGLRYIVHKYNHSKRRLDTSKENKKNTKYILDNFARRKRPKPPLSLSRQRTAATRRTRRRHRLQIERRLRRHKCRRRVLLLGAAAAEHRLEYRSGVAFVVARFLAGAGSGVLRMTARVAARRYGGVLILTVATILRRVFGALRRRRRRTFARRRRTAAAGAASREMHRGERCVGHVRPVTRAARRRRRGGGAGRRRGCGSTIMVRGVCGRRTGEH